MELRNLETFVQVAALGSFTKAADALSVTQPAATRQVAALEAELRTRLLERLGRRVELTDAGRSLLEYATAIVRLAREASTAVADIAAGASGRVSLGASGTAATYLLPPLLMRYRETFPAVDVSVRTAPSRSIAAMVASNAVDLGLVMESRSAEGLTVVKLATYANVAIAHPAHPFASTCPAEGLDASRLAGEPIVLMQPGTTLRAWVDRMLSRANVEADITMELDSVEAIKAMVAAGLGISIVPLIAVRDEARSGRLAALRLDPALAQNEQIAFIHRQDKFLTAAMRSLMALVGSELARTEADLV